MFSLLKEKGLASELTVDIDSYMNKFSVLDVQIELTKSGLNNYEEVLYHLFEAVNTFKKIPV